MIFSMFQCIICKYGGGLYGPRQKMFVDQKLELQELVISIQMFEQVKKSLVENSNLYGDLMSNTLRAILRNLVEGQISVKLAYIYFQLLKKEIVIYVPKIKYVLKKGSCDFKKIIVSK
jgi:hypothetical protein